MPGYALNKGELLARLVKVEGQVRGVRQMVENDRYCIDVLTQISAVHNALKAVSVGLLDDHLRHCVLDAAAADAPDAAARMDEAIAAIARLMGK